MGRLHTSPTPRRLVILYLDSDTFGADRSWIYQRRDELLTHGYQQVDQADTLVLLHR